MHFLNHSNLKGCHATFGASQPSWLRYDLDKMVDKIRGYYRTSLGTEIHEFAASQIMLCHKQSSIKNLRDNLETYIFKKYFDEKNDCLTGFGQKLLNNLGYLPKEVYETVKMYINDGIGYRMKTEQVLYYSDLFYGTADTISFNDDFLRIHDLKTGAIPAHIEQLEIYAALFCLEYKVKPGEIRMELDIYQNGEILFHKPEANDILPIMDKIVHDNKQLTKIIEED